MECTDLESFSSAARDHAQNPRNYGHLSNFNRHARITRPCGDTMEFWLTARNGKVERVSFITDGCGPSLACGSMATSLAAGKRVEDASGMRQQDLLEALCGLPEESEHCALLAANTLKAAFEDYLSYRKEARGEEPRNGDHAGNHQTD
ncbi:MAG: iron-sulfur cluster assembly scaffold protein [Syntrophales bacterium]|nr:iron-sulfur cluster assembly scaffold protein [Syntrophales bacterium]